MFETMLRSAKAHKISATERMLVSASPCSLVLGSACVQCFRNSASNGIGTALLPISAKIHEDAMLLALRCHLVLGPTTAIRCISIRCAFRFAAALSRMLSYQLNLQARHALFSEKRLLRQPVAVISHLRMACLQSPRPG